MDTLESKVMAGIKDAMRNRDEAALRTLRAIKAAILEARTAAGAKETLSGADEIRILQKMAKQRHDTMEIFLKQNRSDLAKKEQEELSILKQMLPEPLSMDELEKELKKIIEETGAKSPADMGKVMGLATKKLSGKADGKMIAERVKSLLQK